MAGDAAGLVDPLLGEGIPYALWSGMLAAHCVVEHLCQGSALANYTDQVQREVINFQRPLRRIATVRAHLDDSEMRRLLGSALLRMEAFRYLILRTEGTEKAAGILAET